MLMLYFVIYIIVKDITIDSINKEYTVNPLYSIYAYGNLV